MGGGFPGQPGAPAAPGQPTRQKGDLQLLPSSLEKRLHEKHGGSGSQPVVMPPEPEQKEYEGSLKSLSAKHGYGFIACEEVYSIYGRDVYLPKDLVPEDVKVLDRLIFTVALSNKGHLQAKTVTAAPKLS